MGKWFGGGAGFDAECREGFGEAHMAAARRELDGWAADAEGAPPVAIVNEAFAKTYLTQ